MFKNHPKKEAIRLTNCVFVFVFVFVFIHSQSISDAKVWKYHASTGFIGYQIYPLLFVGVKDTRVIQRIAQIKSLSKSQSHIYNKLGKKRIIYQQSFFVFGEINIYILICIDIQFTSMHVQLTNDSFNCFGVVQCLSTKQCTQ